jgi:hypothetical protein
LGLGLAASSRKKNNLATKHNKGNDDYYDELYEQSWTQFSEREGNVVVVVVVVFTNSVYMLILINTSLILSDLPSYIYSRIGFHNDRHVLMFVRAVCYGTSVFRTSMRFSIPVCVTPTRPSKYDGTSFRSRSQVISGTMAFS